MKASTRTQGLSKACKNLERPQEGATKTDWSSTNLQNTQNLCLRNFVCFRGLYRHFRGRQMVFNQPLSEWFTMALLTTASLAFPEAGCASISTLVLCVNPSTDTHRHRSKHTEHIHRTHTHRLDALAGIGWDDWDRRGLAGSEFWVGPGSELGQIGRAHV